MAARRVILPSADDLFRPTAPNGRTVNGADDRADDRADDTAASTDAGTPAASQAPERKPGRPSGRVRHDEKMTVYITSEELLEIEHARLALRRTHGLAVDRGRLVREAVAIVLADLEANGGECALVRRLADENP